MNTDGLLAALTVPLCAQTNRAGQLPATKGLFARVEEEFYSVITAVLELYSTAEKWLTPQVLPSPTCLGPNS